MAKISIMNHSLAKALMEAGVQHLDLGGIISGITGAFTPENHCQAQLAPTQTTNYQPTINEAGSNALAGYGASQGIQAQQQSLANALLARSQGQGPNPAQAALNQETGSNIAAQGALMAGQRGASANPALMARQIAMQGAATQQGAVGQGATLQAQQQIAAQQQLAAQQAQMAQGNIAEQGLNASLFGAGSGAQNAQNNTAVNNYAQMQGLNQKTAAENAGAEQKTAGGFLNAAGGALGGLFSGGATAAARGLSLSPASASTMAAAGPMMAYKGGEIPDHLHKMAKIYHPDFSNGSVNFKDGGPVPGKAEKKGNSKDNDTVPALVSPGEVVLPRSVTQAKNAPDKAAEFMRHLQEKDGKKKDSQGGYEKVAKGKKGLEERVKRLEKLCAGGKV